jgi:hypothetical protein
VRRSGAAARTDEGGERAMRHGGRELYMNDHGLLTAAAVVFHQHQPRLHHIQLLQRVRVLRVLQRANE